MFHFNEPMPDCVPEYYRSLQEAADHECAREMQNQAHFLANREKISTAVASGLPILKYCGYDACLDCPNADHDTMTDVDDDFCCVICLNPACPEHEKHQSEGAI